MPLWLMAIQQEEVGDLTQKEKIVQAAIMVAVYANETNKEVKVGNNWVGIQARVLQGVELSTQPTEREDAQFTQLQADDRVRIVGITEGEDEQYYLVYGPLKHPGYQEMVLGFVKAEERGMRTLAVEAGGTDPAPLDETIVEAVEAVNRVLGIQELLEDRASQFASLKGLDSEEVLDGTELVERINERGDEYLVVHFDDTPLLLYSNTNERGEYEWQVATFGRLLEQHGVLFGFSVNGAEQWTDPDYRNAVGEHATMMKEGLSPSLYENWPNMPGNWLEFAQEQDVGWYTGAVVSHYDKDPDWEERMPTREEVDEYVDYRFGELLSKIRATGETGIVDVVAEAMFWSDGEGGWEGQYDPQKSPYYAHYGESLISELFVRGYRVAGELGMEVGEDVIFLYNGYGWEISDSPDLPELNAPPGDKSDFVAQNLVRTKREIAQRLGIPEEEVPLAVGAEFHIPMTQEPPGSWIGVYGGDLTPEGIRNTIERFSQIGDFYITEHEVNYTEDRAEIQPIMRMVISTALGTDKVEGIFLYEPLRFRNLWHSVNSGLFTSDGSFQETEFYFDLLGDVYSSLSKSSP